MSDRGDNVKEPMVRQDGDYRRIDITNLKNVHRQCTDGHDPEIDPTEKSEHWQGYKCRKCGRGELRPL